MKTVVSKLNVEIQTDGFTARLITPMTVIVDDYAITVPTGFMTDFASAPKMFWNIISPWGKYSPAAVVHDYLYYVGNTSRRKADKIFLAIMAGLDVALWKRKIMYWAVRMFAGFIWRKYRRGAKK